MTHKSHTLKILGPWSDSCVSCISPLGHLTVYKTKKCDFDSKIFGIFGHKNEQNGHENGQKNHENGQKNNVEISMQLTYYISKFSEYSQICYR